VQITSSGVFFLTVEHHHPSTSAFSYPKRFLGTDICGGKPGYGAYRFKTAAFKRLLFLLRIIKRLPENFQVAFSYLAFAWKTG